MRYFVGTIIPVVHFISTDLEFLTTRSGGGNEKIPNGVIYSFSLYQWPRNVRKSSRDRLITLFDAVPSYDMTRCFGIAINGVHNTVVDAYSATQIF
jgi:hypothetical protein